VLELEFGRGFGEKNLRRMVQLAEVFPDREIVISLIRQLAWTHFIALLPLKNPFHGISTPQCAVSSVWSVRALRSRIDSMLYERTALSKKPEKLIAQEIQALRERDQLTPDLVFRDPYVLDFLVLRDSYGERDLEDALLRGRGRRQPAYAILTPSESLAKAGLLANTVAGPVFLVWRTYSAVLSSNHVAARHWGMVTAKLSKR
jgi:hypothetical protein